MGSAYTPHIRHGYYYLVQFATLRFYPISSLCNGINTVMYRFVPYILVFITPKLCIYLQNKCSRESTYEKYSVVIENISSI